MVHQIVRSLECQQMPDAGPDVGATVLERRALYRAAHVADLVGGYAHGLQFGGAEETRRTARSCARQSPPRLPPMPLGETLRRDRGAQIVMEAGPGFENQP